MTLVTVQPETVQVGNEYVVSAIDLPLDGEVTLTAHYPDGNSMSATIDEDHDGSFSTGEAQAIPGTYIYAFFKNEDELLGTVDIEVTL